jgi:hypothetical protein
VSDSTLPKGPVSANRTGWRASGAWRDAGNIKAYVNAARQSAGTNMAVFADWAQWALAEAVNRPR